MKRFGILVLGFALTAAPSVWAQSRPCPTTPAEAARIATSEEDFTDADAISWAACSVAAARLFSMIYIGDSEPQTEMMDAVITALDDPSKLVKAQALVAAYQHRNAIVPSLEERVDDTAPSSQLGLVQGDIALAALEALEPERAPGWPLLIRLQGYADIEDPERASAEELYKAFATDRSDENAQSLLNAAATSPYPEEVFDHALLASRSRDADAPIYREAALTAWRRLIAEDAGAIATRLPSMIKGATWYEDRVTEAMALDILGPESLLKYASRSTDFGLIDALKWFSEKKEWTAPQQAQIKIRHSELVIELLYAGEATRAFWGRELAQESYDTPPELDAEAAANGLFAGMRRTLLTSEDMGRGLKVIPGLEEVLKLRAAGGGREAEIAAALLQCAGPEMSDGGFRQGRDQVACFGALLIADGRKPEDAFNASLESGDICLAVAHAGGNTQRGAALLWDLRRMVMAREALGPIPGPAIDLIDCGNLSLHSHITVALYELDPDRMRATVMAEIDQSNAKPTESQTEWLELGGGVMECLHGEFPLADEIAGSQVTDMKKLLGTAQCFDSGNAALAKNEFNVAVDRLSRRWEVFVPQQAVYWVPEEGRPQPPPYEPDQEIEYAPGALPVITAMPKPRLENELDISKLGGREQTLESLKAKIEQGLRRASPGYDTGLFSDGKGGIILLARRERIRSNGEPFDEDRRFTELGNPKASWTDMFGSIIKEKPGQFRVLAFVIAKDVTFDSEADPLDLPLEAIGEVRRLPPALANSKVGNRNVTVLVYVFERPKGKSVRTRAPQSPNAYEHLVKSGVWSALGFSD
jgi:hypothetical protein